MVAAVMVESRAQAPAIHCMWCPSTMNCRLLMDKHLGTWWCKGCVVEIESPMKLSIGRKVGIDP